MHTDLRALFASIPELELAILIGSQASGAAHSDSDWDIAIQWGRGMSFSEQLAITEQLRKTISDSLGVSQQLIDLIDLSVARFAMRAVVAEEGIVLKGEDSLAWHRFLQRTWRELEEQYWEQLYAA